jgi:hypothetical protein
MQSILHKMQSDAAAPAQWERYGLAPAMGHGGGGFFWSEALDGRNERLGLLLVIAAACTSMIVFSAIAMCWEPSADERFRRSAVKHNCLIDRVNVSMIGRFPSTVNGTTIRTSPARAIVRAFLFPKISVDGSERPGAGTFRSDALDAYIHTKYFTKRPFVNSC